MIDMRTLETYFATGTSYVGALRFWAATAATYESLSAFQFFVRGGLLGDGTVGDSNSNALE